MRSVRGWKLLTSQLEDGEPVTQSKGYKMRSVRGCWLLTSQLEVGGPETQPQEYKPLLEALRQIRLVSIEAPKSRNRNKFLGSGIFAAFLKKQGKGG
jgi:hypothetical protein